MAFLNPVTLNLDMRKIGHYLIIGLGLISSTPIAFIALDKISAHDGLSKK